MQNGLREKVAIVTGAGSGIGLACARLLAERGATVWGADIHLPPEAESAFVAGNIHGRRCDVRRESDVIELMGEIAHRHPRIDILVYSAGVLGTGRITEVTEENWDHCIDTNLKGAFFFAKHVIGGMTDGGSIVFISSNAGIMPRVHDPVYCVSKAGLIMLARALALTHASDRIRVNAVCPGPVDHTGMMRHELEQFGDVEKRRREVIAASPLAAAYERMAEPKEIAESVGYLVSEAAAFVTGTVLAIDGGKSIGHPPPRRT